MKLNSFQQLMWRWTTLCPYNVGHVVRIEGRADVAQWRRAITDTIRETGLGIPHVHGATAEFLPVEDVPLHCSYSNIDAAIHAEINTPFPPGTLPVRFFVIDDPDGSHFFGAFFDHWIADSKSFRALMHCILRRYQSPALPPLPPMRLDSGPFHRLFDAGRFYKLRATADCLRDYLRHRRAFRAGLGDPMDFNCGFRYLQAPDGLIDNVRATAKNWQCSVNDIFLATLAQIMGGLTAVERGRQRHRVFRSARNRISLGTAVDIWPFANAPTADLLGLLVSYFAVVLEQPEKIPLRELSGKIAAITKKIKLERRVLRLLMNFQFALFFWDASRKPWTRAQQCHKGLPTVACISNENFTGSWIDAHLDAVGDMPRILDYFRVPPVGPLSPMVLMPTTVRDRMSLSIGYRTTAFTHEQATAIAWEFMQRLASL